MSTSRSTRHAPKLPAHTEPDELPYGELEPNEDYKELNLVGLRFPTVDGISFKQMRLREIDWSDALIRRLDLTDVLWADCRFANTRWEHAGALRIQFDDCRLTGFGLKGASFKHAVFTGCQGRFMHIEGSQLKEARFERCVLTEAGFVDTNLAGAVFIDCDLHHASFKGCDLTGADFRRSNVEASRIAPEALRGALISPLQAVALLERYTGVVVAGGEG